MSLLRLPFLGLRGQIPLIGARPHRLAMESLESRVVLDFALGSMVCFVNSSEDGPIVLGDAITTLREAVEAPVNIGVREIRFDIPVKMPGTNPIINLTEGPLTIDRLPVESLLIDGTNTYVPPGPDLAGTRVNIGAASDERVWILVCGGCRRCDSERIGAVDGIVLRDMDILGNTTFPGGPAGGGIVVNTDSMLTLERVTVAGSEESGPGGAVLNYGSTTINNSTISGNTAMANGGGIANYGTLMLYNSTVSGNTAQINGQGGGIFTAGAETVILNTTIANNSAELSGGGIHAAAPVVLQNSIVGGNAALLGPQLFDATMSVNASYSLIESSDGNGLINGVDGNIVGQSPNLGPLAENGGPTQTHLPNPGSVVMDAGSGSRTSDQRGFSGVVGILDMGSVEAGAQPPPDGDFNGDTVLNLADIDLLSLEIASGGNNPVYDLNGDGMVTLLDQIEWLALAGDQNLGPGRTYLPADANLDGRVDGLDFVVWNAHKFSSGAHGVGRISMQMEPPTARISSSGMFTGFRHPMTARSLHRCRQNFRRTASRHRPRSVGTDRLQVASPARLPTVDPQTKTRSTPNVGGKSSSADFAIARSKSVARPALSADRVDVVQRMLYDLG